jgi:hypothetical protein
VERLSTSGCGPTVHTLRQQWLGPDCPTNLALRRLPRAWAAYVIPSWTTYMYYAYADFERHCILILIKLISLYRFWFCLLRLLFCKLSARDFRAKAKKRAGFQTTYCSDIALRLFYLWFPEITRNIFATASNDNAFHCFFFRCISRNDLRVVLLYNMVEVMTSWFILNQTHFACLYPLDFFVYILLNLFHTVSGCLWIFHLKIKFFKSCFDWRLNLE